MSGLKKLVLVAAVLFTAFAAGRATAQDAPDIAGTWSGTIASPLADVTLVVEVTRGDDGTLGGTIENADQAPGNLAPLSEVTVADGRLAFKVPRVNATYSAEWDESAQLWKGTLDQGGPQALNLARGAPPAKPRIEGLDGVWTGTWERNGVKLRQALRVATGERGTNVLYDSPDQMANGLPVGDLTREGRAIRFSIARGISTFAGELSEDGTQITGAWTSPSLPGQSFVSNFARASDEEVAARRNPARPQLPREPYPYRAEEVAFDNPAFAGVRLAGTLTLPEGEGPFPAAIMITGSGGQDRDETLMGHKPFAVIADHLTRRGIAVLRFDDRGIGKSTGNYGEATSADLATDANAAFAYLLTRPEIRPEAIGMIGHSEGGMIGPIAMRANDQVAYFVSLAGPGTDLVHLMLSQRRLIGAQMGLSAQELDRAEPVLRSLFETMAVAETAEAGYEAAMALLTPEAKVAVGMTPEMDGAILVRQVSGPWFQYFLKYDPAPNWQAMRAPLLALNGSLDLQVPAEANLAAIREATKGNPDATIVELPGLNHLFQTATTGSIGEYATIEETFAPAALELIGDWIGERFVTP